MAESVGAGIHDLGRGGCLPHRQLVVLGVAFVGVVPTTGVDPKPVVARPGWGGPAHVWLAGVGFDHRGATDGGPPTDLDDLVPASRDLRWRPVQDVQRDLDVAGLDAGADHRTPLDDRDQSVTGEVDLRHVRALQQRKPVPRHRRRPPDLSGQQVLRPGPGERRGSVAGGHRGFAQQQHGGADRDAEHRRWLRGPGLDTHPVQDGRRGGHGQRQIGGAVRGGDTWFVGDVGADHQQGGHSRVVGQPLGQRGDESYRARPDLLQHGNAGDRLTLPAHTYPGELAGERLAQEPGQVRSADQIQLRHDHLERAKQACARQRWQ